MKEATAIPPGLRTRPGFGDRPASFSCLEQVVERPHQQGGVELLPGDPAQVGGAGFPGELNAAAVGLTDAAG